MSLAPELKMPKNYPQETEKYILRKAFEDQQQPVLPTEILWRPHESLLDGIGSRWLKMFEEHVQTKISNQDYEKRNEIYPINTPTSKEMFWLRTIFETYFPFKRYYLIKAF